MTAAVIWDDVEVGEELPGLSVAVQRLTLVQYAGASGDFNPIHWNEQFAKSVGLPDVIAHGMLTMALAARVVTSWTGDPASVEDYRVRFSRPVVVPNDWTGATVEVSATVVDKRDDGRVAVDITVACGDEEVLSNAVAIVRLP